MRIKSLTIGIIADINKNYYFSISTKRGCERNTFTGAAAPEFNIICCITVKKNGKSIVKLAVTLNNISFCGLGFSYINVLIRMNSKRTNVKTAGGSYITSEYVCARFKSNALNHNVLHIPPGLITRTGRKFNTADINGPTVNSNAHMIRHIGKTVIGLCRRIPLAACDIPNDIYSTVLINSKLVVNIFAGTVKAADCTRRSTVL